MDWQGLAAILGVPLAAAATVWAIARERSRLRVLERLTTARAAMAVGSRAQTITDSFIDDVAEEIYHQHLTPWRRSTITLLLVASIASQAIAYVLTNTYIDSDRDNVKALVVALVFMASAFTFLVSAALAMKKVHRIARAASVSKYVDDVVSADSVERPKIQLSRE